MTPGNSCLAEAQILSRLLKQNTKFLFRQDTMLSFDTLQRYLCMQRQLSLAEIIKSVQRQLYMRRDSTFCAKSVRYNIFTNGAPQQSSRIAFLTSRFVPLTSGLVVETQRRCYFRCSNFFSVSDRFQTLASLFSCTSGSTAGWKRNLVLGQCFSTPSPQTQLSPRKALAESASTRDK